MLPTLARDSNFDVIQCLRPGATQNVSYDASAATTPLAVGVVRIVSTTDCYIAVGSAPTATSDGMLLPALKPELLRMEAGLKIAAIKVASAGILSVTQMA